MDAAVLACRCERVDRAFEAVEGVRRAVHAHLKRLVVIVAAGFTSRHGDLANRWGWCDNPRAVAPVPGGPALAARRADLVLLSSHLRHARLRDCAAWVRRSPRPVELSPALAGLFLAVLAVAKRVSPDRGRSGLWTNDVHGDHRGCSSLARPKARQVACRCPYQP